MYLTNKNYKIANAPSAIWQRMPGTMIYLFVFFAALLVLTMPLAHDTFQATPFLKICRLVTFGLDVQQLARCDFHRSGWNRPVLRNLPHVFQRILAVSCLHGRVVAQHVPTQQKTTQARRAATHEHTHCAHCFCLFFAQSLRLARVLYSPKDWQKIR